MDAYFRLASRGDSKALELLTNEFYSRAKSVCQIYIGKNSKLSVFPEDFMEIIDSCFLRVINEYDANRGSFSWFVEYVLTRRLMTKIAQTIMDVKDNYGFIIDDELKDENIAEEQPDPNQMNIASDLAIEKFTYRIASPRKGKNKEKRLTDQIMLLQLAGYTEREICEKLNLTKGQLRFRIKKRVDDEDYMNLKLEIK